jgi:outer membrane immunogenic protein
MASPIVLAADMPIVPKAPPAAAVFDWTGFYAGADAGYLWSDSSTILPGGGGFTANVDAKGFSAGAHLGYRNQLASGLVLGLEADIAWLDADGSNLYVPPVATFGRLDFKWSASLRGVVGRAAGRSLFYVTGGAAWLEYDGCSGPAGGACAAPFGGDALGWTAGVGCAYAFSPSLIARIEYLYADYGSHTQATPFAGGGRTIADIATHTIRGGVSWKFGSR